ncbi:MAG TPA: ABC transporter substrate-binding protein [Actinomycetota bacterium]|nr:ABC transporter substrate-binding protein [Actinomycetota bacterium]
MRSTRAVVALLAAVALVGAACGNGDEGGGGGEEGPLDVVLIQGVAGDEFYITMDCGAQAAAEELGVNYSVQGPSEFDPTEQIPIVEAVVAQQPDAILIAPTERTALAGPLQTAQDAGITVVLVDTIVDDPNIGVSRIATDNVEGGRVAGEALLDLIGGKGSVFVNTTQPGVSTVEERVQGFEEVIEGQSGIEYLGAEFNNDDPTRAAEITSAKLAANPNLAGIFATNLFSAEGAATALRDAGAQKEVKLVGFDASPGQVGQLEEGLVQALVAQNPREIGFQGVQTAVAALRGEPFEEQITTPLTVVTKDNLTDPDVRDTLYLGEC